MSKRMTITQECTKCKDKMKIETIKPGYFTPVEKEHTCTMCDDVQKYRFTLQKGGIVRIQMYQGLEHG